MVLIWRRSPYFPSTCPWRSTVHRIEYHGAKKTEKWPGSQGLEFTFIRNLQASSWEVFGDILSGFVDDVVEVGNSTDCFSDDTLTSDPQVIQIPKRRNWHSNPSQNMPKKRYRVGLRGDVNMSIYIIIPQPILPCSIVLGYVLTGLYYLSLIGHYIRWSF